MLLLGTAWHCLNESGVMANAASHQIGVLGFLLGSPRVVVSPQPFPGPHQLESGPAYPAAGWTWMDDLPGFGLFEQGMFPSQGCLLPGDISLQVTPSWDIFPGMCTSHRHLPNGICILGTSSW